MEPELIWPEPWYSLEQEPAQVDGLGKELQAEIGPGHVLTGQSWQVIGRRDDRDDILLLLPDGEVAEVHLTWARHPEPEPWPVTGVYGSFKAWSELQED